MGDNLLMEPTENEINHFMKLYTNDGIIPTGEHHGRYTYGGMEESDYVGCVFIILYSEHGEIALNVHSVDVENQRKKG